MQLGVVQGIPGSGVGGIHSSSMLGNNPMLVNSSGVPSVPSVQFANAGMINIQAPTPVSQPGQMQQAHAIHYVTKIRNRFQNEPDTYRYRMLYHTLHII